MLRCERLAVRSIASAVTLDRLLWSYVANQERRKGMAQQFRI